METIILGTRIPRSFFITSGVGESDVGVHAGSYDDALKAANIENCNVIKYSSVMPPEAVEVLMPEKIHHGAVLETIHSEMSGMHGELLTAGLITWKVRRKSDGRLIGGFVAEYNGHAYQEAAEQNLRDSMSGMNERRGYGEDRFETIDVRLVVRSFTPKKTYGTVLAAIGFLDYIFPIIKA
ncbi:MAG: pyruvoyl-dependent arginine decarboxylase [Pseudomonadota bacterium]